MVHEMEEFHVRYSDNDILIYYYYAFYHRDKMYGSQGKIQDKGNSIYIERKSSKQTCKMKEK